MKLSLYEQETIILYNQAEASTEVYTHDSRLLEKLRCLAEKFPDQIVKKNHQTFPACLTWSRITPNAARPPVNGLRGRLKP